MRPLAPKASALARLSYTPNLLVPHMGVEPILVRVLSAMHLPIVLLRQSGIPTRNRT
jgi:hypothetical protein